MKNMIYFSLTGKDIGRNLDIEVFTRKDNITKEELEESLLNDGLQIAWDKDYWDIVTRGSNGFVIKRKK